MKMIAKSPSTSYSSFGACFPRIFRTALNQATADKFVGPGIAGLLPIPRLLHPFQGYPSQAIVHDGINKATPRLYSLSINASTTGRPSNGSVARISNAIGNHWSPTPDSINYHRLPTPKRGLDVAEIPVEIICEIFEKFIEDDSQPNDDDPPPRPLAPHSCRSDPTILGQICSRWRAVAIDLPKLWSNICIHNPKSSQVRLVNLWLARSANSPLYLKFDCNRQEDVCDLGAASLILTSFISRLEYWNKIDFRVPLQLLGTFLSMVEVPKIPLFLQSCVFGFNSSRGYRYKQHFGPQIDAIWKVLHTSPNLRRVNWGGAGAYNLPTHAPFHQLTHVETHFEFSTDDVLVFLSATPLIEELWISTITLPPKTTPEPSGSPLFLRHLRALIVSSRGITTCSLLSSLICPSLQSLRLNHNSLTGQPDQNLSELIPFLRRSTCHLHTLKIADPHLSDAVLEFYLQSPIFLFLRYLWVTTDIVSDRIIYLLMKKTGDGSHQTLPRLEKLFLHVCETTDGLLSTMISSRWHNDETRLGSLRWAMVTPKKTFGSIDKHFFNTHKLY